MIFCLQWLACSRLSVGGVSGSLKWLEIPLLYVAIWPLISAQQAAYKNWTYSSSMLNWPDHNPYLHSRSSSGRTIKRHVWVKNWLGAQSYSTLQCQPNIREQIFPYLNEAFVTVPPLPQNVVCTHWHAFIRTGKMNREWANSIKCTPLILVKTGCKPLGTSPGKRICTKFYVHAESCSFEWCSVVYFVFFVRGNLYVTFLQAEPRVIFFKSWKWDDRDAVYLDWVGDDNDLHLHFFPY